MKRIAHLNRGLARILQGKEDQAQFDFIEPEADRTLEPMLRERIAAIRRSL